MAERHDTHGSAVDYGDEDEDDELEFAEEDDEVAEPATRRKPGILCLIACAVVLFALSMLLQGRSRQTDPADYTCPALNMSTQDEGFTVVINTFRRNACLRWALEHWARCSAVKQIRISWSDVERPPPRWLTACAVDEPSRFVVDTYKYNRLSNRFRPLPASATESLFSVDDDLLYDCRLATEAHAEWQRRRRDPLAKPAGSRPMVGFAPRLLRAGKAYDWVDSYKRPFVKNTLFVTKGAFMHRDDYDLLWRPEFEPLVAMVDEHTTAEDISMSVVFAAWRGVPPVHVVAHATQVTDLCCTSSTKMSDGLAGVQPRNAESRRKDPVCREGMRASLHATKRVYRLSIQKEALRLAGDAITRVNTTSTTVMPSTLALLGNISNKDWSTMHAASRYELFHRHTLATVR